MTERNGFALKLFRECFANEMPLNKKNGRHFFDCYQHISECPKAKAPSESQICIGVSLTVPLVINTQS